MRSAKKKRNLPASSYQFVAQVGVPIALIIFVLASQYHILKPVLSYGFNWDDWFRLVVFKLQVNNPLIDFLFMIKNWGLHDAPQMYYIGFVERIFGLNYWKIQTFEIFLKILATLSLYPLVVVLFKNKFLGVMTVIFFSLAPSTAGTLDFVVAGGDYLSVCLTSLFIVAYYHSITKSKKHKIGDYITTNIILGFISVIISLKFLGIENLLSTLLIVGFLSHLIFLNIKKKIFIDRHNVLSSVLFSLAFLFSPIRFYPLLTLPLIIESFFLVFKRRFKKLDPSFTRLVIIYFPIAIFIFSSQSTGSQVEHAINFFKKVTQGEWHYLLTFIYPLVLSFFYKPLLGSFINTVDNSRIFKYLLTVALKPTLFMIISSLILVIIVRYSDLRRFLKNLIVAMGVPNLIVFIVELTAKESSPLEYDPRILPPSIIGLYFLALGVVLGIEYLSNRNKDPLLVALAISPYFSLVSTALTRLGVNYYGTFPIPVHRYLLVPSIGGSLFFAALTILIYERIKSVGNRYLVVVFFVCISYFFVFLYRINIKILSEHFNNGLRIGYGSFNQELLFSRFKRKLNLGDNGILDNTIIFFELKEDDTVKGYYNNALLSLVTYRILYLTGKDQRVCFSKVETEEDETESLKNFVKIQEGKKGFISLSLCIEESNFLIPRDAFFTPENFYAFRIYNSEFVDIRKEVLEELDF